MLEGINYEAEHRKLWNWLAEHPEQRRTHYFSKERGLDPLDRPTDGCFACEEAIKRCKERGTSARCSMCPIGGNKVMGCCFGPGLFDNWRNAIFAEDFALGAKIARQIAQLPWREVEAVDKEEEDDE